MTTIPAASDQPAEGPARPAAVSAIARRIYPEGPPILRKMQHWRSFICPYHLLVGLVPQGARVLDVGCGGGLLLGVLAETGRISGGLGFDSSAPAISMARDMAARLPSGHGVEFRRLDATAPWPEGRFDLVSMIDVMHHVPPEAQRSVFAQAAARVGPGECFLYKDMGHRPLWRATANRLHDLALARQWIHYAPVEDVLRWGAEEGLAVQERRSIDMLWYRHELVLFRRPGAEATRPSSHSAGPDGHVSRANLREAGGRKSAPPRPRRNPAAPDGAPGLRSRDRFARLGVIRPRGMGPIDRVPSLGTRLVGAIEMDGSEVPALMAAGAAEVAPSRMEVHPGGPLRRGGDDAASRSEPPDTPESGRLPRRPFPSAIRRGCA